MKVCIPAIRAPRGSPAIVANELFNRFALFRRGRIGRITQWGKGRWNHVSRQSQDLPRRLRIERRNPACAEAFFSGGKNEMRHRYRGINLCGIPAVRLSHPGLRWDGAGGQHEGCLDKPRLSVDSAQLGFAPFRSNDDNTEGLKVTRGRRQAHGLEDSCQLVILDRVGLVRPDAVSFSGQILKRHDGIGLLRRLSRNKMRHVAVRMVSNARGLFVQRERRDQRPGSMPAGRYQRKLHQARLRRGAPRPPTARRPNGRVASASRWNVIAFPASAHATRHRLRAHESCGSVNLAEDRLRQPPH